MLYLNKIISNTGSHLAKCLKLDKPINTLAKRMYKEGNTIFAANGIEMCLSNECELDGFFYVTDRKPKYQDDLGCIDPITGFEVRSILFLYGRKECEDTWESDFCECLSRYSTTVENTQTSIQILNISDDIPSIIKGHFSHVKKQFQTAQPCTTLFKIELKFDINIC